MTDQELFSYYSGLLLSQYAASPNAVATIQLMASVFTIGQLPAAMQNAFQIGTNAANPNNSPAVGPQLDILAKYVGVTRNGIGVYQQPITLNDSDFTILIQMGIATNNFGSDLYTIDSFLQTYFQNQILVFDNENMTLNYLVVGSIASSNLIQMFITQNLLPQPMGVEIAAITYVTTISLFGMLNYNSIPNAYSSATNYALGAQVIDNGIVYQSIVGNNLNNPVTNMDFWLAIIYPMNDYNTYPTFEPFTWLSYGDAIIV